MVVDRTSEAVCPSSSKSNGMTAVIASLSSTMHPCQRYHESIMWIRTDHDQTAFEVEKQLLIGNQGFGVSAAQIAVEWLSRAPHEVQLFIRIGYFTKAYGYYSPRSINLSNRETAFNWT